MTEKKKLFKEQGDYFDVPSQDLSPRQLREKLAQLASNFISSKALGELGALLTPKGGKDLNGGTGVTDDLKYNSMCFFFSHLIHRNSIIMRMILLL